MATRRTTTGLRALSAATMLLGATLSATTATATEAPERSLVGASLVADVRSVQPGVTFHLGVRFEIADSWHINWTNPGDAGLAPSIDWQLPDGFDAGHVEWPHPQRYAAGPLVIFGYGGTVTLWTTVTTPAALSPGGEIRLRAAVAWLACREEFVPGEAQLGLALPVEALARPDTAASRSLRDTARRVPVSGGEWTIAARYNADELVLEIDAGMSFDGPLPDGVIFFPDIPGIIENGEPQRQESGANGVRLSVPRSRTVGITPQRLTGVLVSTTGWGPSVPAALRVDVPLEGR